MYLYKSALHSSAFDEISGSEQCDDHAPFAL